MIHTGDCVEVMAGMDAASVDAIVTDPPYGLEFMGKEWDSLRSHIGNPNMKPKGRAIAAEWNGMNAQVSPGVRKRVPWCRRCGKFQFAPGPSKCHCKEPDWNARMDEGGRQMQAWHQDWAEAAFRIAKPGAYLLAFGGTRTYHRMTCAIEDAGWIIRDCLVWAYASGFPKSKALLKPAWEPIVMARKPGPLRELAIDACRIGTDELTQHGRNDGPNVAMNGRNYAEEAGRAWSGRWPANLILTDPIFDGDTPGVVGGGRSDPLGGPGRQDAYVSDGTTGWKDGGEQGPLYFDGGTYSRFFILPKADRAEREPILLPTGHDPSSRFTTHPTVKPLDLMRHLVRLVTPTGGTVCDPFLGSGTTALAAEMEGFAWVGIEREPEYVAIAEARLNGTQRGLGLPAW